MDEILIHYYTVAMYAMTTWLMTDKSEIVPYGQRSTTLQMMSYLHKDRMDNDIPTPTPSCSMGSVHPPNKPESATYMTVRCLLKNWNWNSIFTPELCVVTTTDITIWKTGTMSLTKWADCQGHWFRGGNKWSWRPKAAFPRDWGFDYPVEPLWSHFIRLSPSQEASMDRRVCGEEEKLGR